MTRRAPLLVVAAAILLTAAWWYLLYQPRRVEQADLIDQTAQLETERGQLQSQIVVLREVEDNEADYRSQLARLREYIPEDPGQPAALEALQQAADSSGVAITQLTFADPELVEEAPETNEELTALARIPTLMTVTGGYFQIVDLLRRIEVDFARAVKVSAVTMTEETEQSFPELTVATTGHIFAVLPVTDGAENDAEVLGPDGEPVEAATEAAAEGASEQATAAPGAADAAEEGTS